MKVVPLTKKQPFGFSPLAKSRVPWLCVYRSDNYCGRLHDEERMRPDGPALGVCVKLRVAPDKGSARGAKVPSSGVREHQPNRQPEISLPPFRVMRYIPQTHTHSLIHPLVGCT